jgi:hypothetical protein
MRWKVVLAVGGAVSAGLVFAAFAALPAHRDGSMPAVPIYLGWAGIGGIAITLALAWLVVVDTPVEVGRAVVILTSVVTLVAVGEGAIYVDRHPSYGLCVRHGHGRATCYQQPNRPEAARHAEEILFGGAATVLIMASAALVAVRRVTVAREA